MHHVRIRVSERVGAAALLGSLYTTYRGVAVAGHVAQLAAPEVTGVAIQEVALCTVV